MTTVIDASIRKALEKQLTLACPEANTSKLIEWPNLPFNRKAALKSENGLGYFLKPTFHPTDERPRTLGNAPRVEHKGFFKIGIYAEPGGSEDLVDSVVGLIRDGFPYSQPLTRDGLTIEITRRQRGTATPVDGWYYLSISVYWTLWRET